MVRPRFAGPAVCAAVLVTGLAGLAPARAVSTVAVTPLSTWGTKVVNGKAQKVLSVLQTGDKVYLAGEFTTLVSPAGATATRQHLAALDAATGELSGWNLGADGRVYALAVSPDQQRLYLGGDFSHVAGVSAPKVAAIDLATNTVDPSFKPKVSGRVRALAVSGGRLYAGGDFHSVAGSARPQLAALDATTGALLPWTPPANAGGSYVGHMGTPTDEGDGFVAALAVSGDGAAVYAGGSFLRFAGQGGLLALDAATGQALPSQWDVGRPVFALAMSPNGHTFFAAAGGAGGRALAFDPSKPTGPVWAVKVDGDAVGVAASDSTVYVTGHYGYVVPTSSSCYQQCPNGTARKHLLAVDAQSGALQSWNPTTDTISGPYPVTVGSGGVYVGGVFTKINNVAQPGFALFPGTP
jgi:outer membrane protein assembly factor BamB